jgi:hypothetical protein
MGDTGSAGKPAEEAVLLQKRQNIMETVMSNNERKEIP